MTRTGKIARLPRHLRESLNIQLADGKPAKQILAWLNELDTVKNLMEIEFNSRPISEQNLSEWKNGGYQDWLRHQEAMDWMQARREEAGELTEDGDALPLSEEIAPMVALALGKLLHGLATNPDNQPEKHQQIVHLGRELNNLRKQDHEGVKLRILLAEQARKKKSRERSAESDGVSDRISMLWKALLKEQQIRDLLKAFPEEKHAELRDFIRANPYDHLTSSDAGEEEDDSPGDTPEPE